MKYEISKTLFKEYSKCDSCFSLYNIYRMKNKSEFDEDTNKKYLDLMFDKDGNDLVFPIDRQMEIMLPYYKEVEKISMDIASSTFNKKFNYYEDNLKQKEIKFIDENGYLFHTYLDGYYEDNDEIYIIEVKATTNNGFLNMGPKIKGQFISIFKKDSNIISLKEEAYKLKEFQNAYKKLYDRNDDSGSYIYDIAITSFIMDNYLKQNGINKKVNYYLAVLNSKYEYDGVSLYNKFKGEDVVNFIDVNDILSNYKEILLNDYNNIVRRISEKKLNSLYSKNCKECPFKKICFPLFNDKDNIESLLVPKKVIINGEKMDVICLINNGYHYIKDLPYEALEHRNHVIQWESVCNDYVHMNKDNIKRIINENIKYPIYHLDFESFQSPLPRFYKEKPYMHSVFQYSIHIQKDKNECRFKEDNYYFLPSDFLDHREEMIKEMIETIDLSNGGTVLVYNKNFEYSRICEFIKMFPKYKEKLQNILDHMFDLLDVVRKDKDSDEINFYDKRLHGSFSIKKVLPIFTNMSYDNLGVKNGVEAQIAYGMFKTLDKEDIISLRNQLIEYCGQDTYSMYLILKEIDK